MHEQHDVREIITMSMKGAEIWGFNDLFQSNGSWSSIKDDTNKKYTVIALLSQHKESIIIAQNNEYCR